MIKCIFETETVPESKLRHCTTGTILTQGDKILLVRRSEDSFLEPGKWCLPGGFLDRDETIEQGAAREVLEETGHESSSYKLLIVNSDPNRPKEDRQNIDFIFVAEAGEKIQKSDNEISEVRWFDKTALPNPSEIAFDHMDNLQWYIDHPDLELRLVGLQRPIHRPI